ncbi:MAG: hypothetical protein ACP5FH_07840 [Terracidiphilus sp.]
MEVFVRGSRSSTRDWSTAQRVSANELPQLNENQKAEAQRGNISEEVYARTILAEKLTGEKLLRKMLKFGRWLDAKVEERNRKARIERVELDTLSGRIEITLTEDGETTDFEVDEDLIEKFLTTGSSESESSILRLLDVYVPREQVAKAS